MRIKILKQIKNKKITPQEGYDLLYCSQSKSGRFITFKMSIDNNRFVSTFINILFFIPWPIGIAKFILNKVLKKQKIDIDKQTINEVFRSSRHLAVDIHANDAKIKIKIL